MLNSKMANLQGNDMDKNKHTNTVSEYDITSSPRDLALSHIVELIETGQMEIPLFQREYVWKIKQASKLIDSLILNLPIPEIFLFMEGEDGRYRVIDGQQRLLSIYFFFKQRFPKDIKTDRTARTRMHELINEKSTFLPDIINDDKYFKLFRLEFEEDYESSNAGKTFNDLDPELQMKLRLRRSIRAQVLRQNKPDDGGSAMFEVFNRLNTGGSTLTAQEIRASLYYCDFYKMMQRLNNHFVWKQLLNIKSDELHSKDIEYILTAFAFLENKDIYAGNKQKFLNRYSRDSKKFDEPRIKKLENIFIKFLEAFETVDRNLLCISGKFSVLVFETVFSILCADAYKNGSEINVDTRKLKELRSDNRFMDCLTKSTATAETVMRKFAIAKNRLS